MRKCMYAVEGCKDYQDPSMKILSWMAIGREKQQRLINTPWGHPGLPKPELTKHEVAQIAEKEISKVTRIAKKYLLKFVLFVLFYLFFI